MVNLVPQDDLDRRFRGLITPIEQRPGGPFAVAFTRDIIKSSIRMILTTRQGERVMLPEFGSRLPLLIFEPNDSFLRQLAERYVVDDLARWEPRIRTSGIRILSNEHLLEITIDYEILSISIEDAVTLVFRREQQGNLLPGA